MLQMCWSMFFWGIMTESGRVQVEISPESADAVAKVSEMKTSWAADPTMVRGAKKVRDRQGDPGHAHGHGVRKRSKPVMTLGRKRKHEEAEDGPVEQEPLTHVDYRKKLQGRKGHQTQVGGDSGFGRCGFPRFKKLWSWDSKVPVEKLMELKIWCGKVSLSTPLLAWLACPCSNIYFELFWLDFNGSLAFPFFRVPMSIIVSECFR